MRKVGTSSREGRYTLEAKFKQQAFSCSPLQPAPSATETAATSEKNSAMKVSSVDQSTKEDPLP